jgi:hypothetical protein
MTETDKNRLYHLRERLKTARMRRRSANDDVRYLVRLIAQTKAEIQMREADIDVTTPAMEAVCPAARCESNSEAGTNDA